MGNLLLRTDNQGNIIIPKTKIQITIRPSDFDQNFQQIQEQVFSLLRVWERAGFRFELMPFDSRDQISEGMQNRIFGINTRTTYQQEGFYIDFNRTELGQAYQSVLPADSFAGTSDRISISPARATLLKADVIHEVGHALGLAHEHQRIDRDQFVLPQNGAHYQQALSSGQQLGIDNSFVPFGWYDHLSVMHYPGIFSTKEHGMPSIGGTIQNPQFPDHPSNGDITTARFLFNEARIQEELKAQAQKISYEQTPYGDKKPPLSVAFPSQNPLTPGGLDAHKVKQATRLNNLKDTRNTSLEATLMRSDQAIRDQREQLEKLKLPIEELDNKLIAVSTHQLSMYRSQCSNTPSSTHS